MNIYNNTLLLKNKYLKQVICIIMINCCLIYFKLPKLSFLQLKIFLKFTNTCQVLIKILQLISNNIFQFNLYLNNN